MTAESAPDSARAGRFGDFGGQYIPETLMPACAELEQAWTAAQSDAASRRSWMNCCATTWAAPRR